MPARGNVDYLGLEAKRRAEREERRNSAHAGGSGGFGGGDDELAAPGISMIAAAHKRARRR